MKYLHWDQQTITDFSEKNVADMYERGYLFTRIGKGVMQQTRSVRIDLSKFELTSENRRILKKIFDVSLTVVEMPYSEYDWSVAKLAKDFYSVKFGGGIKSIMGAAKIKELLTDNSKSNFNLLLIYNQAEKKLGHHTGQKLALGYAICHANRNLIHYCYPFYELDKSPKDMGLGMMIRAIMRAKELGKKYIYLGSLQRPSDTYKLQFNGLEWFDGGPGGTNKWSTDIEAVKKILSSAKI